MEVRPQQDMRLRRTPLPLAVAARAARVGAGEGGIGPVVPPQAARRARIQGGQSPPWIVLKSCAWR